MTNDELRITNLRSAARFFMLLCALCVFAGNSPAQDSVAAAETIDLLPYTGIFENVIRPSSVEKKRDALLELRNYRTANASRIAVAALKDDSEIVRATATATVVFLPSVEALRALIPLLADKKPFVRREAAAALGIVGDAGAIADLVRLVRRDKVSEVRSAAIVALGAIGDASAIPELVRILQRKPQPKEEFARRSAARAVGQIAQIVQTGKVTVVTPENFLPERDKLIEQPARIELTGAFPPFNSAANVLIGILSNPQEAADVRREAAFALGAIGDASAIPVLQSNARDADYYLAEICREALHKITAAQNRR